MSTHSPSQCPIEFILNEARLLNQAKFTDWLSLFAEDGIYWVPLKGEDQVDFKNHVSLACEDKFLLATRIKRLESPRAHSLVPGVRSLHVIQTPQIETASSLESELIVQTPFVYMETLGDRMSYLSGIWIHKLRSSADGYRIVMKRVNLLNANTAHEAIQLFP
jgi:3-phenylpropionate/cinnamic acid dioxygenase small subunit